MRMAERPPADDRVGRMEFMLTLRRRGIANAGVLRAMDEVPREQFVPNEFYEEAYVDRALPIACGQTISQPYVVAYMSEQLDVRPGCRVLEVGTGSGYQAAILSRLARAVVTVERYRTLAEAARARLETLARRNVTVVIGDGLEGMPDGAPYDRILLTAAVPEIPAVLLGQLAENGVMILPLGPPDRPQDLVRLTKTASGIQREDLILVRFPPLVSGTAREL